MVLKRSFLHAHSIYSCHNVVNIVQLFDSVISRNQDQQLYLQLKTIQYSLRHLLKWPKL